jgi:oxygen-independent coproporphyrinogen-3 oxidase
MSGIYLHIPFCKQACSYCDFYFVTRTSEREHFINRLTEEIQSYRDSKFIEETVETIYFGGGTPSLLEPQQVEHILNSLYDVFDIDSEETTFEMNPDDVSKEFLSELHSLGINRASMGVQSFQPELLTLMNRAHTRDEALQSLKLIRQSDFDSFNVDLLYGNPGESMGQLEADLGKMLSFDPPHVSAYSLTIESNTRLGKQVDMGRIVPPEDEKVAGQLNVINE